MCVVKVNRVESNCLGYSNKDPSHNSHCSTFLSPPLPMTNTLKADTDTHIDHPHFSGSGVMSRTTEGLRQWPEATKMHPANNESQCCSAEQQSPSSSQNCSNKDCLQDDSKLHSSSHITGTSADIKMSLCLPDSKTETSCSSCREDSLSQTLNTDNSLDTGTGNHSNTAKAETMDSTVDLKHINCHSTAEALYDVKTEPVEGDSHTSCGALSPSGHNCSLEKSSTEEIFFPPLLQRNAGDMPLLTPEPENKVRNCSLPPVLTQEMPSLTPAHDGITEVSRSRSCNDQVAPVLQREMPSDSLSSNGTKQEDGGTDFMMTCESVTVEQSNIWPLALPNNCEGVAPSGSEGNTAFLNAGRMHKTTSGGVHEMSLMPEIVAENDLTNLENITIGQSDTSPHQLVQSNAPQKESQYSLAGLATKDDSEQLSPRNNVLNMTITDSLLTGTSSNNPLPSSPPLCTQSDSHSALQLYHLTKYSQCASQNPYIEPKPFSSSIWKNLNSHSSAVLIQSLNSEPPSNFTHDPLPYTMWTEPRYKEVTDLQSSEQELHESESQEEESGPLTWAQLQPTSLVSVGAGESLGLCGYYELHRGESEVSEATSLCRELGRQREPQKILHSDTVSPLVMGREEQDRGSDMEEDVSDCEEADQQSARGGSSSDLSDEEEEDEEEEDNDGQNYQCYKSGLEPGEICAVSTHSHIIIHIQSLAQILYKFISMLMPFNVCPIYQYPGLSVKGASKSWRHPLRKPTARAVPTAVKQQAASDDGGHTKTHTHTHIQLT